MFNVQQAKYVNQRKRMISIRLRMNRGIRLSVSIPVRIRLGLKWIINDVLANQFCSAIINYRQGVRFKPYTLCGFPTVITYGRKLRARCVVDDNGPLHDPV